MRFTACKGRACTVKPGFHYPSWRPELTAQVDEWSVSITRQHGPCWRARVSTSRVPVNSASGNRALMLMSQSQSCKRSDCRTWSWTNFEPRLMHFASRTTHIWYWATVAASRRLVHRVLAAASWNMISIIVVDRRTASRMSRMGLQDRRTFLMLQTANTRRRNTRTGFVFVLFCVLRPLSLCRQQNS